MSNPLISVIVPVYKVEKYLYRCIDSILGQTLGDFELILVDDGSPDNCGKICDSYAEQDKRIKVIHQENKGQAAARNTASKIAAGEFISFVDSDDFIVSDHLEYLFGLQQKFNADISIGQADYFYDGKSPSAQTQDMVAEVLLDAAGALMRMNYNQGYGATAWAKLYKKDLILSHPFPEGQIYEDLAVLYQIVGAADRIVYGNKVIYHWLQRDGSTMRSAFDERQMAALEATKAQINFVQDRYPAALPSAKARHEAKIIELMPNALAGKNAYRSYLRLKQESRYSTEVLADPKVKKTQKLRIAAMKMGYFPSQFVFRVHERLKRRMH